MKAGTKQAIGAALAIAFMAPALWLVLNGNQDIEHIPDDPNIGLKTFNELSTAIEKYQEKHGKLPDLTNPDARNDFFDRYGTSDLTRILSPATDEGTVPLNPTPTERKNLLSPVYNPFLANPEYEFKETDVLVFSPVYSQVPVGPPASTYVVLYASGEVESFTSAEWSKVKKQKVAWSPESEQVSDMDNSNG